MGHLRHGQEETAAVFMTGAHPEHILVQIVNISTAQLATTRVPSYKLWSWLHKKPILHIILVLTGAHIFRLQEVGLPSPMQHSIIKE